MLDLGEPEHMAHVHNAFEVNIRLGRQDALSDDVKRLTGREPMSFREYLVENKDLFPAKVGHGNQWIGQ